MVGSLESLFSYLLIPTLSVWAIIAAVTLALIGMFWQRKVKRDALTFQMLMDQMWDQSYINSRKRFIEIRDNFSPEQKKALAEKNAESSDDANTIRSILNNYELIALCIMKGIISGSIYKKYYRSSFVRDFKLSSDYIEALRKKYPTAYIQYGKLYKKWRTKEE